MLLASGNATARRLHFRARAAVALILRPIQNCSSDSDGSSVARAAAKHVSAHNYQSLPVSGAAAAAPTPPPVELEMLFILRAANAMDRWARQVALPGGRMSRRKDGGREFNTVVRELREEMGLHLDRPYVAIFSTHLYCPALPSCVSLASTLTVSGYFDFQSPVIALLRRGDSVVRVPPRSHIIAAAHALPLPP